MKIFTRLCVLLFVFASHSSNAQDCSGPRVGLGEIMAGLQAGLTAGVNSENALAAGFATAVNFEPTRGFIIPETFVASIQCDNDYLLIGEWFACGIDGPIIMRTPKEALDCVSAGLNGRVIDYYFEIDGITVDHIETGTKIGSLPSSFLDLRYAFFTAGHIIEPFTLAPGFHTATFVLLWDPDADGPIDPFERLFTAEFTIIESGAACSAPAT